MQPAVVDAAAHRNGPPIRIDLRADGLHQGRVAHARQCIKRDLCGLARAHLALQPLGQTEVHIHRSEVFNVDDVGPVLEVVAHVDTPNARNTIERGHDLEALGGGLGQRQLGLCHFQVGSTLIHRALADKTLGHQLLVALVVGLRDGQLGLALLNLRTGQLVVQLHQHLPTPHALAIVKVQLGDAPPHLGAEHDALARLEAPHGFGIVAQRHLSHGHGLHGHGAAGTRSGTTAHRCTRPARPGLGTLRWLGRFLQPPGSARCSRDANDSENEVLVLGRHGSVNPLRWEHSHTM